MKKLFAAIVAGSLMGTVQAQDDISIVLIPGLTTDAFYITMNKGAQAAAEALGIKVDFQGAEDFNPTLQVPVLDAVISRQPDAILIAPTDTTQLIEPSEELPSGVCRWLPWTRSSTMASTRTELVMVIFQCPTSPQTTWLAVEWQQRQWVKAWVEKAVCTSPM